MTKETESTMFVDASPPVYEFTIETTWITMKDNVHLSVTFLRPVPLHPDENFPALFEFLP